MSFPHATPERFATLPELYEHGLEKLDRDVLNYLEGGAGADETVVANRNAFQRWVFRPRLMSGIAQPDLSIELLGVPLSMPICIAPFGGDRLFHGDGHLAVARAAQDAGIVSIVPEVGSYSLEAVAQAAPAAARFFQLHPVGQPENFVVMGRRAINAGYTALCITVDNNVEARRERSMRDRFAPDPHAFLGNYQPPHGPDPQQFFGPMHDPTNPSWTWTQLGDACAQIGAPYIVKGILTADDARSALDCGAAGIVVSNHGGRQIPCAPASLDQLEEVVAEVNGAVPILLDSGIRRGTDVIKALCLGASAVLLGRTIARGLSADGQSGVARVLELFQEEMQTAMALLGYGSLAAIGRYAVQRADMGEAERRR